MIAPRYQLFDWWEQENSWRCIERVPNIIQHTGDITSISGTILGDFKNQLSPMSRSTTFQFDEDNRTFSNLMGTGTYHYLGCYKDNVSHPTKRDLQGNYRNDVDYALPEKCKEWCRRDKYRFFGLSGKLCQCSNQFGFYGKANDEECIIPCSDFSYCGGVGYNSIYKI